MGLIRQCIVFASDSDNTINFMYLNKTNQIKIIDFFLEKSKELRKSDIPFTDLDIIKFYFEQRIKNALGLEDIAMENIYVCGTQSNLLERVKWYYEETLNQKTPLWVRRLYRLIDEDKFDSIAVKLRYIE